MKAVVVGAGGIGQWTAQGLAEAGYEVVLGSRSGTGIAPGVARTPHPGVTTARVDAADAESLARLAAGATVIVNAVNPPYTRWPELWPPVARALLSAAASSGAGLLTIGNLYGYGPVAGPMTEDLPLASNGVKGRVRAQMWQEAAAAHVAGRLRATELRASDYFGPGAGASVSYLNTYAIAPAMRGRAAQFVTGDVDAPHSWTYIADIARTAVAVAGADQDGPDWGRPWHVPTSPPRSMREVTQEVAAIAGTRAKAPGLYPAPVRRLLRLVPIIRELDETAHQFEHPFVLDASDAERRFGLAPTPWREALAATVSWLRER